MVMTILNKDAEIKKIGKGEFTNTGLNKKDLVKRSLAVKQEGMSYEPTLKELSTYIYPTRGFFGQSTPNQGSKIDHKTLIDSHGMMAVDIMASGMLSGLTSPSRPWFKLGLADEELAQLHPVKAWLDKSTEIVSAIYQKSNIYGMLHSIYTEIATFGTACSYIEEDFDTIVRARTYTAGEYYIACNQKGQVNAFYRRYWMTAGQMVKEFKIENCSPKVQAQYKNNTPDTWNMVNFFIEENDDRIPFMADFSNMPYRAAYWEDGLQDDSYLMLGGYEEFPILAPRWDITTTADTMGKGPGWKALGDVKMLQKLQKNKLIALDKQTNPPLQADASVDGEVNTLPGGITHFSSQLPNAGVKPTYEVNINLQALEETIERTKQAIGKYLFTDMFLMLLEAERQGREMTATEIIEKQAEKLSMLGPVLERLENELLNPLTERCFNIAQRLGLIPEPPIEIQGEDIKIHYISVLAQAQKMQGMAAIDQWVGSILETAAATQRPDLLDSVNFDELANEKAAMLGIPAKIQNSPEAIAALRDARNKAAAQQAQQESQLNMAEAAKKGAGAVKDLATAPVGANTALDSLTGQMQKVRGQ